MGQMKRTIRGEFKMPDPRGCQINFTMTPIEVQLILTIIDRLYKEHPIHGWADQRAVAMDLACVNNTCPLDLVRLLHSEYIDFGADMSGIFRNVNRKTGHLMNGFRPRCAKKV